MSKTGKGIDQKQITAQNFKSGDLAVMKNGDILEIEHIDFTKMRIYARRYKNSLLSELKNEEIEKIKGVKHE